MHVPVCGHSDLRTCNFSNFRDAFDSYLLTKGVNLLEAVVDLDQSGRQIRLWPPSCLVNTIRRGGCCRSLPLIPA